MSSARLIVRLTPRGGRDAITGWSSDGTLRIRVAAAPSDGAANEALIRLLARALDVAPSRVSIESGRTSRTKTVALDGLDTALARQMLDDAMGVR